MNHDSLLHPIDDLESETHFRVFLILLLQMGGALAVFVSRRMYGVPLPHDQYVWLLDVGGFVSGAIFASIAYYASWKGVPAFILRAFSYNANSVETNEVVSLACALLMVLDAILCGLLVMYTGGLFQSIFSPLLLAIVGIAFTFRLPRPTLAWTIGCVVGCVCICELLYQGHPQWHWNYSAGDGHYKGAVICSIVATTMLTVAASAGSLFNRLPTRFIDRICDRLTAFISYRAEHHDALQCGLRTFAWDVSRRTTSSTLSQVHDLNAVVEQAVILNIPYGGAPLEQTRRAIAYMTFASHWIDDFFDHLYNNPGNIRCSDCTAEQVFKTSRHLRRLYRDIRRRLCIKANLLNRMLHIFEKRFLCPSSSESIGRRVGCRLKGNCGREKERDAVETGESRGAMIDRGLVRIVLAGVLQRCPDFGGIEPIISRCVQEITRPNGFDSSIAQAYACMEQDKDQWIVIWGTAKAVMELFDCCAPDFDVNITELYSLLYTPLMVFQNIGAEVQRESISDAFQRMVLRLDADAPPAPEASSPSNPFEGLTPRLKRCLDVFRDNSDLLRKEDPHRREERLKQLQATLVLYGPRLPADLLQAYFEIVKDGSLWGETTMRLPLADGKASAS